MKLAEARTAAAIPITLIWMASSIPALAYRPGLFNAAGSAGLSLICNRRSPKWDW
jgi:hypothetical protein